MINRLKVKSEFHRNVLTLLTGTTIAQAIPILVSPVLTRLFSPKEFGLFAMYYSLLVILNSISSGKYELSILLPKREINAKHLVVSTISLSLFVCTLILSIILYKEKEILVLFNIQELSFWIYFLPVNIFAMSSFTTLYYLNNRNKQYKPMAKARVVYSLARASSNLTIGFFTLISNGGLIFGSIIGSLLSLMYLWEKTKVFLLGTKYSFTRSKFLLKKYKKFPIYKVPSVLLENISSQFPVFFLNIYFGAAITGFYSLSQRIIRIPITLIGKSIGDVFKQVATKHYNQFGNCKKVFTKTFYKLFLISTIPFLLLYFIAPELFKIIFGDEWYVAGEYVRILVPMFYLQFLTSPLSNMFMIAEKQNIDFFMQIVLLVSLVIGLFATYFMYNDVKISLTVFCWIYCIKYLVELILSYKFSLQKAKI